MNRFLCFLILIYFTSIGNSAYGNYAAGMKAYSKRNYAAAAPLFFQGFQFYKNNKERQLAQWGLAQSLEKLGLFYSASKYYSMIVRKGPNGNPNFRKAMEQLGNINSNVSLGQSHIVELFAKGNKRISPASIPGAARGFYFYYMGLEAFGKRRFSEAKKYFASVPSRSGEYRKKALFHLGVIANLSNRRNNAIGLFEQVRSLAGSNGWLKELANINIARVYYEQRNYRESIKYYAQVRRFSDNWLDAIFESAWAFFLMEKFNNTLGNIHTIHSPFFVHRFYPETYILRAIAFLRLCDTKNALGTLRGFRDKFKPVAGNIRSLLKQYKSNPRQFFKLVYDYKTGNYSRQFKASSAILDSISRKDAYKEAGRTIRFSDRELNRLSSVSGKWQQTGLKNELLRFLKGKKDAAIRDAGRRLYKDAAAAYSYLRELSNQTELIITELNLIKIDQLRKKLKVGTAEKKTNFIGGLAELRVGQDLEYWPFEGEYWIDELGGYVYNLKSQCK